MENQKFTTVIKILYLLSKTLSIWKNWHCLRIERRKFLTVSPTVYCIYTKP